MFITYINKDGNKETQDFLKVPENFIKIDNIYFEKAIEETKPTKTPKKEVEVASIKVEETKEEVIDDEVVHNATEPLGFTELELKAREFLKEKKIRGYGLLKNDKLVQKAIENGFVA